LKNKCSHVIIKKGKTVFLNFCGTASPMAALFHATPERRSTAPAGKASGIFRSTAGFSLAEVLISAILVTICLAAVGVVVRVGTQLQTTDNNHRQARAILRSTFENEFCFRQYATIPDSASTNIIINIDPRDGNILQGEMTKLTASDTVTATNGTSLPVKKITLTLRWNETGTLAGDTIPRSITMHKMLAAVQ
jgi:type II secretory pathway pseudopilin PulG